MRRPRSTSSMTAARAAAGVAVAATLVVTGCSNGNPDTAGPDADADTDATAAGSEVARFEDERLAFDHPADWEVVEQGGPDEFRTRLEPRGADDGDGAGDGGADDGELPDGAIVVLWPFVANWDLDAAVAAWGPDEDDPVVTDVTEEEVAVPGAEAAVAHAYRVTDVAGGGGFGEQPATYRSVIAMAEVGRAVVVMVAAPDDSDVDLDAVADLVLDSLALEPSWDR